MKAEDKKTIMNLIKELSNSIDRWNNTSVKFFFADLSAAARGDMETPHHGNASKKRNHKTNLMSSSLIKKNILTIILPLI